MATYQEATIQQSTGEIRKWTFDYTDDLPTGITVSSGTATHTPPSGSAGSVTVTAASPYLYLQLGPLAVTGVHYLDGKATLSNGEVSEIRLTFTVNYPTVTARSGLVDLINELRMMTDASANDFTIAGVPYWSDKQLEKELDKRRTDIIRDELTPATTYNNGTVEYKRYFSNYGNFEQTTGGTTIFYLENAAGTILGSALYTVDYIRGEVIFSADTTGSAVYLYGRSYDLNGAAANVWRFKAANSAKLYDFSTDNHRLNRSQVMQQCIAMAKYYESQASPTVIDLYREDL